jgi:sugar lactone lactonase YvrE
MRYGPDTHTHEPAGRQAQYPGGRQPVEVDALLTDADDRLYAFNTGEYLVTAFDRDGALLSTWDTPFFSTRGARMIQKPIRRT